MVSEMLQSVEWSRAQFALTAIYHWLFVPLTLGLSVLCALMETRYYRTGDPFWRSTTKFWMRLFGINFAIGVATGLILEFAVRHQLVELLQLRGRHLRCAAGHRGDHGLLPRIDLRGGDVLRLGQGEPRLPPLGYVAHGHRRQPFGAVDSGGQQLDAVSRRMFVQHRHGAQRDGFVLDVLFSPVAINKFSHTVTSSFLLAAIFVMGVSAWYLLRGRHRRMARSSIALASVFGLVFALVAAFSGDRSGAIVARVQPMKLAAMEALYDGEEGAPLTVVGLLRPEGQRTCDDNAFYFKIGIPKLLSLMSFRSADAFVPGINDLVYGNEERGILSMAEKMSRGRRAIDQLGRYHEAREKGDEAAMHEVERLFDASTPEGAAFLRDYYAYFGYGYLRSPQETVPNVPLVFYSFRVMVGAGCFFILLCAVVWWLNRRDRLAGKRWLLRVMILSIPLAYLASQAGWIVAEVGRQPWTIQNLLPACVSGSHIAATPVAVTFFIFLALFTVLLAAELAIMLRQIKIGPNE